MAQGSSIEPPIYAALHRNEKMEREWVALQQMLGYSRFWEHEWTGDRPPAMCAAELILAVHLTELQMGDVTDDDETLRLLLEALEVYQEILENVVPYGLGEASLEDELRLNAQGYFLRDDTLLRKLDPDYPKDKQEAHTLFTFPYQIRMTYPGSRAHAIREASSDMEAGLFKMLCE